MKKVRNQTKREREKAEKRKEKRRECELEVAIDIPKTSNTTCHNTEKIKRLNQTKQLLKRKEVGQKKSYKGK